MAERGSLQRRENYSALMSAAGQWSTGLPPDGYGEAFSSNELIMQSHDLSSSRGKLMEAPTLNTASGIYYYKMRGYYVAGSTYETWVSISVPNFTPPSGHSLVDVAVSSVVRI